MQRKLRKGIGMEQRKLSRGYKAGEVEQGKYRENREGGNGAGTSGVRVN